MAVKGISGLNWTAPPKVTKFSNTSGKDRNVPMAGRGALIDIGKRQTGDSQKQLLIRAAKAGIPHVPPGGKINIAA